MESDDDKTRTHVVLTKGTMVSHYRIARKIGAGGMGEVYLAEDTKLKRQVALKFLPPHLCQDEDCRKRFTREAQAAASLDHPNIIHVHEVSEFKERPFFAMQHVEGQSLREMIAGRDLPIDRILEIVTQVCEGLQAAHNKGIIHRDVKPSNILIDGHGRVRIVDFGLASVVGSDQLTKTGSTLGTVGYMSPEQVQGKEIDHRSDLFSLGVVLYELITKQNPFKRDSEAATLAAVSQNNPEPLTRYKADIPDELQRTVSKLLEKDPSLRYQVASGVTSDLKRLIAPMQSSISVSPVRRGSRWPLWAGVGVAALVLVAVLGWRFLQTDEEPVASKGRKMLAVLPFENLGAAEDEYFADGMTEEITARLAVVHNLGVIARTSAIRYKQTNKSIKQIGEELGVDYILEGTIRWQKTDESAGRIRVTPQLIKVSDATHIWAEIYDEVLTQVFEVQTNIAQRVVEELHIVLASSEQKAIETKPTENLRAYDLYVRGWEYRDRFMSKNDLLRAMELFEQAIALDSNFVAAYGALSMTHSNLYWFGYDHTPERVEKARYTADLAVESDPEGPWGQFALGYYYYYCVREYDRALMQFERMLATVPNQPEALSAVAYVKRRKGEFDEAAELQQRALEIDPLSFSIRLNLAMTFSRLRRWVAVETLLKETILLYPDNPLLVAYLSFMYVGARGDVEAARAVIREASEHQDSTVFNWVYYFMAVVERDFDLAISIDPIGIDTALTAIDSADFYSTRANALHWGGHENESQVYYDSARVILEGLEYEEFVASPWGSPSLGKAYAGLGRKEDAIRAGKEAIEFFPLSEDAMAGTTPLADMAEIYARLGEPDLACDLIDQLMSIPSNLTTAYLRLNPGWDPLRDHPRFQELIEKYEKEYET